MVTWPLGARGPRTGLRNNTIARRTCVSRNKMPNKKKNNAARNAFYFFMVSLKPQLERQGVVLENGMQSLAEIAGPRWKVLCLQHSFLEATWGHWNFLYFNLNFTKRVYDKIWTITICCYFKFTPVYLPSSVLKVVSISFSAREEYQRKGPSWKTRTFVFNFRSVVPWHIGLFTKENKFVKPAEVLFS